MNMTKNNKLKEKIAIVTGAARGIGKSIAIGLAKEGANVIITDILEKEAKETIIELQKNNSKCMFIKTDVSKRIEVREMMRNVANAFGRIDILVNNAGISGRSTIEDLSEEWLDRVISVDVKGPFFCIQAVYPYMKEQRYGKIVNIVSSAVKMGGTVAIEKKLDGSSIISRTVPAYVIAKGGLIALTKWVSKDGGKYGILCNAISPGYISSPLTINYQYDFKELPIARMGEPEDIANAAIFLASDESSYITGHILDVDGGI